MDTGIPKLIPWKGCTVFFLGGRGQFDVQQFLLDTSNTSTNITLPKSHIFKNLPKKKVQTKHHSPRQDMAVGAPMPFRLRFYRVVNHRGVSFPLPPCRESTRHHMELRRAPARREDDMFSPSLGMFGDVF